MKNKFADTAPKPNVIGFLLLFIAIVLLVSVLIAIGAGAINTFLVGDTGPRLICTVQGEVVFSADVEAATEANGVITITRAGHTGPITPPTGGECVIAR